MANPEVPISPCLAGKMMDLHGAAGAEWLRRLPTLVAECARRWSLTVTPPFPGIGYSYVAPVAREGVDDAVLKVAFPNHEFTSEREALRLYGGCGAVRLLDADPDRGALLLERLQPGTPLTTVTDDEQATVIAARVMRELWRPAPREHSFPTVGDRAAGLRKLRDHYGGGTGPLPTALVEQAEALFAELLDSMAEPVLLHGDLHHGNILAAQRRPWLAIDPNGVVGEPAYEVGSLLRNPWPQPWAVPEIDCILARRLDVLADELGIERARLHGWGLAQAVLSAWWCIEDRGRGWEPAIAYAKALASIRP